jgi:hypothetical protein
LFSPVTAKARAPEAANAEFAQNLLQGVAAQEAFLALFDDEFDDYDSLARD